MPKISAHRVDASATSSARRPQILDAEGVHRRITGICFKTGPPQHRRRLGAETEWIVVDPADPAQPVDPDTLRHLQTLIGPPPGGSRLTIEPGGQVELSSQPATDAAACLAALGRDVAHLTAALADADLALAPTATDAWSLRPRLLDSPRYRAMEAYFDTLGEHRAGCGRAMMRATASLQVNLETGADAADIAHRWRLLHDVGPTLVAAFANSPRLAGERTGWVSTRQAIWRDLDPPRTHAPADLLDPAAGYAALALDAPLMFVRDGDDCVPAPGGSLRDWIEGRLPALRPPEPADLDAHLTTLFPPVRARGFFEVRYLDSQPPRWWPVPVVVLAALADHRDLGDRALAVCRDVRDAWDRAARDGVRDPGLGAVARDLLADVARTLARRGQGEQADLVRAFADHYTDRGRCPADDTADVTADVTAERFAESTIAAAPPAGPGRHVRRSTSLRSVDHHAATAETAKRSSASGATFPGAPDPSDDPTTLEAT